MDSPKFSGKKIEETWKKRGSNVEASLIRPLMQSLKRTVMQNLTSSGNPLKIEPIRPGGGRVAGRVVDGLPIENNNGNREKRKRAKNRIAAGKDKVAARVAEKKRSAPGGLPQLPQG